MSVDDEWLRRRDAAAAQGTRLISLPAVEAWVRGRVETWAAYGLHADIRPPTSGRNKNVLWVDLDKPGILARLVVWDSGEWEVQRMDAETGALEVSPYRPVPSLADLTAAVEEEMRRMNILSEEGWRP